LQKRLNFHSLSYSTDLSSFSSAESVALMHDPEWCYFHLATLTLATSFQSINSLTDSQLFLTFPRPRHIFKVLLGYLGTLRPKASGGSTTLIGAEIGRAAVPPGDILAPPGRLLPPLRL